MVEFYIRLFKVLSHQSFPLHKSSLNCSRLLDIQVHVALQFGLPRQLSPDRERFPSYHLYPLLNSSSQLANLIRSGPWGDLLAVPTINTTFQLLMHLNGLFTNRFNCSEKCLQDYKLQCSLHKCPLTLCKASLDPILYANRAWGLQYPTVYKPMLWDMAYS